MRKEKRTRIIVVNINTKQANLRLGSIFVMQGDDKKYCSSKCQHTMYSKRTWERCSIGPDPRLKAGLLCCCWDFASLKSWTWKSSKCSEYFNLKNWTLFYIINHILCVKERERGRERERQTDRQIHSMHSIDSCQMLSLLKVHYWALLILHVALEFEASQVSNLCLA